VSKQKLISNLSSTEVNSVIQNFRITAKAVQKIADKESRKK